MDNLSRRGPAIANVMPLPENHPSPLIFPHFGGFSPILPSPINTTVLNLFQDAMNPNRPVSGGEREALETRRELALEVLHSHFESKTHERAIEILAACWASRHPFCLYLRSFALGARNQTPVATTPNEDGLSITEMTTAVRMEDERFQRVLTDDIFPSMPVIGIENPSFDFRRSNCLPRLTLCDDTWQQVVATLIRAAEVIIVYFDEASSGLLAELEMISQSNRQDSCVILINPGIKSGDHLQGFPSPILWGEDEQACHLLTKAFFAVEPQKVRKVFSEVPPLPDFPEVPAHIRAEADYVISAGFGVAGAALGENKLIEAADKLVVCLCMAYWSDNSEARSMAFLFLARAFFRGNKFAQGVSNLQRALDIFERLVARNGTKTASLPERFDDFLAVLRNHQGERTALGLVDRIQQLNAASDAVVMNESRNIQM